MSSRKALIEVILGNCVGELERRGDLLTDREGAYQKYISHFEPNKGPPEERTWRARVHHVLTDSFKAPEVKQGLVPCVLVTDDNTLILSPWHRSVPQESVLLDLIGAAIQHRLTLRSKQSKDEFIRNGGMALVLDKLIPVADKLGFDAVYLNHLRTMRQKQD